MSNDSFKYYCCLYDIVQYSVAILEELEYLANLRHCARCFGIQNALFLHSEQAS